jgi:hypothetical protein
MKIKPEALYERLTEVDADDVVDEVLAMSPAEVRAALRDLGYHLPTTRANIRRRAGFPPHRSTSGYVSVGLGLTGLGGIGALLWTALMATAASPPPENDTKPAVTAAAPSPEELPDTQPDAGPDTGDDER